MSMRDAPPAGAHTIGAQLQSDVKEAITHIIQILTMSATTTTITTNMIYLYSSRKM